MTMRAIAETTGQLWNNLINRFSIPEDQWTTIDSMIYGMENYFEYDEAVARETRMKAIREAFDHHYSNNLFYHRYCKDNNIQPDDIETESDLSSIPLVPDTFFKDYPEEDPKSVYEWLYRVSSVNIGEYDFKGSGMQDFLRWAEHRLRGIVTHSSGTTGNFSIMFRDELTTRRLFYAFDKTLLFSIVHPDDDAQFVYPGPVKTYLTMGHWISEGTKVFDKSQRHFLTERELTMDIVRLMSGQIRGFKDKLKLKLLQKVMKKGQYKLIKLLENLNKAEQQVIILTFPFQLYDLMEIMQREGVSLSLGDQNSIVITGGGWKIHQGKKVSPQIFAGMIEETLGIPPEHYKDIYGMSEMNALGIDCEGRYKHLHPWLYPMVLDENNELKGYEEEGRFAFLDPVSHSYPGFLATGDNVKLYESCPACNRPGIVMDSDISRMAGAEAKGCGNLMRDLIAGELQ